MGVPGFFVWLLNNYKQHSIIIPNISDNNMNKLEKDIDILYLDANCLFHPICFKVLEDTKKNIPKKKMEEQMIKEIIEYINYLIIMIKPKKYTFISVDGVAPMAKINQQRKRRYKSTYDAEFKNKLKKKHGIEIINEWSNICITPGTVFMENLHIQILNYINKTDHKIYYASYHSIGEGEHKILEDIRCCSNNNMMIYGLDADLIFLSLSDKSDNNNNIYLLREMEHFGILNKDVQLNINNSDEIHNDDNKNNKKNDSKYKDIKFNLIDINQLKISLNNFFCDYVKEKKSNYVININDISFVNDFVFLCFFLGNDFLPHLPSIDIKTNGMDLIMKCYVEAFAEIEENLIFSDFKINMKFFKKFIELLSSYEDYYFKNILPNYISICNQKKNTDIIDEYSLDLWKYENLVDEKIIDPIKLGIDNHDLYKFRYYEHYFNSLEFQQELIHNMCVNYLHGLIWTLKYYFVGCASYEWQYVYSHAPFLSDISKHMNKYNTKLDIKFENTDVIEPFIQLLAVIPPMHKDLLPRSYRILYNDDSPIIDYFPNSMHIDKINKVLNWKTICMVPPVCIKRLRNYTKNKKLNDNEKERNISNYNCIIYN